MPNVLIEVLKQYPMETEKPLMGAVYSALSQSFKIFPDDRNVRLLAHESHRFECLPDREAPKFYTYISIDCLAARRIESKRTLYKTIVENLVPFGIYCNYVKIMHSEIAAENWGVSGGKAACDVDLGFEMEV